MLIVTNNTPHLIVLSLALALFGPKAFADDPSGDWGGVIAGSSHMVIHIGKFPNGSFDVKLQNLDEGKALIPADKVDISADNMNLTFPTIGGRYDGRWDAQKGSWLGFWSDDGKNALDLVRVDAAAIKAMSPRRPQEEAIERGPLPYRQESIRFENARARVTLAGTFSAPPGRGPFPTVLLLAGSGPMSRDEEAAAHQVFLVLADHLNRHGIATLRYDKRGVGNSSGKFESAKIKDFRSDALSAVQYLRARPDVDSRRIGLVGHSEGGTIAADVAATDPLINFLVIMAGSGLRGTQLLTEQRVLQAADSGISTERVVLIRAFYQNLFQSVSTAPTKEEAERRAKPLINAAIASGIIPTQDGPEYLRFVVSDPIRDVLRVDPIPTLKKIKVPVLALVGSLDHTMVPHPYLDAMHAGLKNNSAATVLEIKGLNHMFQTAKTGTSMEFGEIEETMSPLALQAVGDWLVRQMH